MSRSIQSSTTKIDELVEKVREAHRALTDAREHKSRADRAQEAAWRAEAKAIGALDAAQQELLSAVEAEPP